MYDLICDAITCSVLSSDTTRIITINRNSKPEKNRKYGNHFYIKSPSKNRLYKLNSQLANDREKALVSFSLQCGPKKLTPFVLYALISSNIDRFSNLFHCQNQQNISNNNNIVTKDPTTPQVCRYTTL